MKRYECHYWITETGDHVFMPNDVVVAYEMYHWMAATFGPPGHHTKPRADARWIMKRFRDRDNMVKAAVVTFNKADAAVVLLRFVSELDDEPLFYPSLSHLMPSLTRQKLSDNVRGSHKTVIRINMFSGGVSVARVPASGHSKHVETGMHVELVVDKYINLNQLRSSLVVGGNLSVAIGMIVDRCANPNEMSAQGMLFEMIPLV